jgi:branched-chain amino acid transport system permease protein
VNPGLLLEVAASGLLLGGLYALLAIGLNVQYGLMRVLNVAHGEFLMLGGYLTFWLHVSMGADPLMTVLAIGPAAFAAGVGIHALLYRRLLRLKRTREELEANSLLISFGLLFILQNVALLIWSADIRGYSYLDRPLVALGMTFPANRVVAFVVAAVLTAALFAFLKRTMVGTAIRALMQDAIGSRLMGLPVARIHAACFGLGAGLAAVTGSLVSMLFSLTPFVGLPFTVTALVVIILGGLGSVTGSLVGGLLLGVVESLGVHFTAPDLRMVLSYGVLALTLILRPYGLFNPMARRPGQASWE